MGSEPSDAIAASPPLPPEAHAALAVLQRHLGHSMMAAYLSGSAMLGGLRPHSDVDLLVLVSAPIAGDARLSLIDALMAISGPHAASGPARPLEVTVVVADDIIPWRYPPRCELQFGEWLRADFLARRVPAARDDPDITILLATARLRSHTLLGPPATRQFEPVPAADLRRAIHGILPDVVEGWHEDQRHAVLALCRMWMTLSTGEIVPKDVAGEWVAPLLPPELRPVVELACAAYRGEIRDDWTALRDRTEAFVTHVRKTIEAQA